jgi:NADPH:quinone reductase-like Zn-dependent oxidoreductase
MKAIVLKQHGDLGNVAYESVSKPRIKPDEVLVEIKAAALNRVDLWVMAGWLGLNLNFPHILGSDGAGIIAEVGQSVSSFAPGDRVAINPTHSCGLCHFCKIGRDNMCDHFALFGEHIPGFFAEYQAVPARNLLKMPEGASFELAAAASLVYVTAWHSLIEAGGFQAGEDILVVGAAGGVNLAYVDIARLAGSSAIYVVGSSEEKLSLARSKGANETYNYNEEDWSKRVFYASGRKGIDVVADNVGASTFAKSLRALKRGGRLLTVGNTSGAKVEIDNRYVFGKHLKIIGTTMGPIKDYEKVMQLVFNGRLTSVIDTVYPLSEGVEALRQLQDRGALGKFVLKV